MIKLTRSLAVISLLLLQVPIIRAQESKIITGLVTAFGEIPLNNVEIQATKSGDKTVTNEHGLFSLSCEGKDMIRVYAYGFDSHRIKVRNTDSLHIDLVYSNKDNSKADAINHGHITRWIIEDAIEKYPLKGEKDYSNYTSIYDLIRAEIFNVNVNGTSITNLKPSSLTLSQEVLCVVNGIIRDDISFVEPSDVKSVKFVDGSGAARYGARGGNGVIEITLR